LSNFKFYVLTTRNVNLLDRHIDKGYSGIPIEDLVVVINTKDSEYEKEAAEWCASKGIEYHITESNGTAARGKNSVLEIFLKSDQDYFVMIDGDDYLTPHGVWMYNQVAMKESPPDAICLKSQISLVIDNEALDSWVEENYREGEDNTHLSPPEELFYVKPHRVFEIPPDSDSRFFNRDATDSYADMRIRIESKMYYTKQKLYCEPKEAHCRVTWFSKKAAKFKFKESLFVGEDTVQYYHLKNEQYHGRLDMFANVESPPTYVYDMSNPGVVCEVGNHGKDNHKWLFPYNLEVCNMERAKIMHKNYKLPELVVDYPTDYVPEAYNLTENHLWDVEVDGSVAMQIEHPANCSPKSLEEKYKSLI
jgi:glycosyltransferase involved in cell wall biosynthesis